MREAHSKGLVSYYTDIGKDKINNRAYLNICATVTFPAVPEVTFDLVITTRSYKSAILEAASNEFEVDLDEIANKIFAKNSRNILASFKSTL